MTNNSKYWCLSFRPSILAWSTLCCIVKRDLTCPYKGLGEASRKNHTVMKSIHQIWCIKKFYLINIYTQYCFITNFIFGVFLYSYIDVSPYCKFYSSTYGTNVTENPNFRLFNLKPTSRMFCSLYRNHLTKRCDARP